MECHWARYQLLSNVSPVLHIHRGGLRLNFLHEILLETVYTYSKRLFSHSHIWINLCLPLSLGCEFLESKTFLFKHPLSFPFSYLVASNMLSSAGHSVVLGAFVTWGSGRVDQRKERFYSHSLYILTTPAKCLLTPNMEAVQQQWTLMRRHQRQEGKKFGKFWSLLTIYWVPGTLLCILLHLLPWWLRG